MRILMISAEAPPMKRAGALVDVLDACRMSSENANTKSASFFRSIAEIREKAEVEPRTRA